MSSDITLRTVTPELLVTKEQKTALNMAKFIQGQTLLLLEKLNTLDLDREADVCEKMHEDAERLYRQIAALFDSPTV